VPEVLQCVSLVLQGPTSLRAAARVLELSLGIERHWSTIRMWLMRVGLGRTTRLLPIAPDWVWFVDHSVQIGCCKCLVILGIQLSVYPWGRPLTYGDLEPIAVVPMQKATKETVQECLETATQRTGVPRAIVDDHGSDLHGGVKLFQQSHPQTAEVYDVKHKAACLLRTRLERDETWKSFCTQVGKSKFALQQTELAPLTPPSQRSKARFMNLDILVQWGVKTLALLDQPARLPAEMPTTRLVAKLGWLQDYREALAEWSADLSVIEDTLKFTRTEGMFAGAAEILAPHLPSPSAPGGALAAQLIKFVKEQSASAARREQLPASTEILESCFGKLKYLEHEQSKSGFTGLVLSLGAIVGPLTAEVVKDALERCRVKDVLNWCRQKLGPSIQSQKTAAYATRKRATKTT
jgi:hypothetical protein